MPPANFLAAKFKGRIDCLILGDAWPTLGKGDRYSLINFRLWNPTDKGGEGLSTLGGRKISGSSSDRLATLHVDAPPEEFRIAGLYFLLQPKTLNAWVRG